MNGGNRTTAARSSVTGAWDGLLRMDVVAANGVPFRLLLDPGYVSDKTRVGLVRVYDLRYAFGPDGQLTPGGTAALSLLAADNWRKPWNFNAGIPDWTIDGTTMRAVREWVGLAMDNPVPV